MFLPQKELEKILKEYGEEKFARRISTAIIKERDEVGSIETTKQLAKIVADHMPKKEIGQDPATRTFQALRIYVNRELEELREVHNHPDQALSDGAQSLKPEVLRHW